MDRSGSRQRLMLPFPVRTQFWVPDLLKKAAEQFAAVLDSQLLIHMHTVRFHCIFADDQGRGNLPVALAAQEEFSASLRNEVDLRQLKESLVAVVEETMQPAHVSLWMPPGSRKRTPNTNQ